MFSMPIVNLLERGRELIETGKRVSVLWQHPTPWFFWRAGVNIGASFTSIRATRPCR